MREKILQKLDAEYEFFFLESMRNSKANLFAKSFEIETKKQVQEFLREFIRTSAALSDDKFARQLYLSDNLMDECYRYAADHPEQDLEKNCEAYLLKKTEQKK